MMNDFMVLSEEDERFLLEHIMNDNSESDDDEAATNQNNDRSTTIIDSSKADNNGSSLNLYDHWEEHDGDNDPLHLLQLLSTDPDADVGGKQQDNIILQNDNTGSSSSITIFTDDASSACEDIEPVPLSNILQQPYHQHDHTYEATINNNEEKNKKVQNYEEERMMSPLTLPPPAATPTSKLLPCSFVSTSFLKPTEKDFYETSPTTTADIITDESVQEEKSNISSCGDSVSITSHTITTTSSSSSLSSSRSGSSIHSVSSSSSSSLSSSPPRTSRRNNKATNHCDEKKASFLVPGTSLLDNNTIKLTANTTDNITNDVETTNTSNNDEAKRRRAIRKEIMNANKIASAITAAAGLLPNIGSTTSTRSTTTTTTSLPPLDETTEAVLPEVTTTTTNDISEIAYLLLNDAILKNQSTDDEQPSSSSSSKQQSLVALSSPKTTKSGIYITNIGNNNEENNGDKTDGMFPAQNNNKKKKTRRTSSIKKNPTTTTKMSSRSCTTVDCSIKKTRNETTNASPSVVTGTKSNHRTHQGNESDAPLSMTNNSTGIRHDHTNDHDNHDNVPEHLADLPTGTDPESRKQRRLMRNRLSAALHRKRKRETIDTQQKLLDEKDSEITKLTEDLQKMTLNYEEIKHDFDIVVNHYGYSEIKTILGRAAAVSSEKEDIVDLVSTDRSSNDDLSSEEDTTPKFFFSHKEKKDRSTSSIRNHSSPSLSYVAVASNTSTKKKKKRSFAAVHNYIPATAMATMAMCAVLSCVLLPSGLFKLLDPDGSGLDTANGIVSSEFGSDARRRLDEALSPDEMNDLMKISRQNQDQNKWRSSFKNMVVPSCHRGNNEDSSLVSPMECQPHLWRYDETTGSPWIFDHSITLFQVDPQQSSVLPMITKKQSSSSPSLMMPSLLLPGTTFHDSMDDEVQIVYSHPKPNLRGSSYTDDVSNGGSDHYHSTVFDSSTSNEDESKSIDLFYRQRRRRTDGAGTSQDRFSTSLSPNFMFCPKAYGSFQSDFMQLMLRGRSSNAAVPTKHRTSTLQDEKFSDLYKSKEDIKCDMIVDFDDDDLDDIDDEGFKDAIAEIMDTTTKEEANETKGFDVVVPPTRYYYYDDVLLPHHSSQVDMKNDDTHSVIKNEIILEPSSAAGSGPAQPPPYMSILVPASTLLRPNDIVNTMSTWEQGINTNITDDDSDDGHGHHHHQHGQEDQQPQAWIELGCHVLTAKLVDGVHFVGDQGSNSRIL